ncbi:MAG: replication-relaxation family protein [Deltaproteobacteria bacterium]|nr:replication-relaxation family protein [Deltaproteobacteria bacterium]
MTPDVATGESARRPGLGRSRVAGTMRAANLIGFMAENGGAATPSQLSAYSGMSLRSAQRDLARLVRIGRLRREPRPSISQGRKEFVYRLGRKPRDLPHRLGIVDVAVAFVSSGRELGIAAQTTTHERFDGLIPDCAIVLERDGKRMLAFLEVDLATESVRTLADKAERYLGVLAANGYHALTGIDGSAFRSFRVCIATTSDRRVESIVRALPGEPSRVFFVSTLEAAQRDPYGAVWRVPGIDGVHRLVRERGANPDADAGVNPVAGNDMIAAPFGGDSGQIASEDSAVLRELNA